MVRQEGYVKVLEELEVLRESAAGSHGRSARLEVSMIDGAMAYMHANLVRCGERYLLLDDSVLILDREDRFRISKDAMEEVMTAAEFESFMAGIRDDGRRVYSASGSEEALPAEYEYSEDPEKPAITPDILEKPAPEAMEEEEPEETTEVPEAEKCSELFGEEELEGYSFPDEEEAYTESWAYMEDVEEFADTYIGMTPEQRSAHKEMLRQRKAAEAKKKAEAAERKPEPKRVQADGSENSALSTGPAQKAPADTGLSSVSTIRRDELLQFYEAVAVSLGNEQVGMFELIAAPLDPKDSEGKFVYWTKKCGSASPYMSVSIDRGNGREEGSYRLGKKQELVLTLVPVLENGYFTVRLETNSDKPYKFSIAGAKKLGRTGHITFADKDNGASIHIFPTMTGNNDDNYAPFFCVVQSGELRAINMPNGNGVIDVGEKSYILKARWDGDRLIAAIN